MSDRHMYQIQQQHLNDIFERWSTVYESPWHHCLGDEDHERFTNWALDELQVMAEDKHPGVWNLRLVMRRHKIEEQIFSVRE